MGETKWGERLGKEDKIGTIINLVAKHNCIRTVNIAINMNSYRTKSLFHYTRRIDNIIDILVSGKLIPNYCSEDLSTKANPNSVIGIPQICFCDIPVSMADIFVENYGRYAIGFNKQWGIDNGCNPVQYVNDESIIEGMFFYHSIWTKYKNTWDKNPNDLGQKLIQIWMEDDSHKARNHMFGFVKKYIGEWQGKPYCNYEENEWRYIIEEGFNEIWWMWGKNEYDVWRGDHRKKKPEPSENMKLLGLQFNTDDINHIILYDEKKIPIFINKLQKAIEKKRLIIDNEQLLRLLSKITSFERIKNDY